MKEAIILLVIFSLAFFSYSQKNYGYSFYNNGTCQSTQAEACIPCQLTPTYPVYYFKLSESPYYFNGFEAYSYEDSLCNDKVNSAAVSIDTQCSTQFSNNCAFYVYTESISTLSLTISSTESVVVSFIGDFHVYTEISANKVYAQGERLGVIQIHSAGKTFYVERQVSLTQYASSIGVLTLGETYTRTPFTFTVSSVEIDYPFPPVTSDITTVSFSPFFSAHVTNDNTYSTIHREDAQITVFVDGSYNLEGLVVANPILSFQNMTFFPQFQQNNNYGELVFQLEASNGSPFLTTECRQYTSTMGDTSYTHDIYECDVGSIIGAFFSFTQDDLAEQKIRQPDEMSFSLF